MEKEKKRSFKHLTWNDRLIIERMLKNGYTKQQIAEVIGCCIRTVYYEVKRATYEHTNTDLTTETRYNPDGSQKRYEQMQSHKGCKSKLEKDKRQRKYIESLIKDLKYSPSAALMEIKNNNLTFDTNISSVNTIYRAIRKGLFEDITMEHLPRHGKGMKKRQHIVVQARPSAGTSIEKRPEYINLRQEIGHWEMDCVIGKQSNKKVLLVLTERKTRMEIVEILKTKTTKEVVKALNRLEKRFKSNFYKIFKSITVDNGAEFYDTKGMEKALYRVGNRTKIYYCHARSPQERGSNEVQNQLIRRFHPKSCDFDKELRRTKIKNTEWWINTYPRRLFNGGNSLEYFYSELEKIGCNIVI